MTAKIVAVTQPYVKVRPDDPLSPMMTADEFIAYCARVSNPANQRNTDTAPKLIKYLLDNAHHSPFEMVNVVMEIKTTRDIGRQILRHRSFSFQEFSQRYAAVIDKPVYREARMQDTKNRQNSIKIEDVDLDTAWEAMQESVWENAEHVYQWALRQGIAKEVARAVLPEGLTGTTLYMSGTLRSWIHYCQLRIEKGVTQKEHVDVATKCWEQIAPVFPSVAKAIDLLPGGKVEVSGDVAEYGTYFTVGPTIK